MFKKFTSLFCTFVIILSIFAFCGTGAIAASDIEVDAAACMLVEAESGTVLFQENADTRVYPASTTKIMTVITALKAVEAGRVNLDDIVVISDNAYFDIDKDASSQNLVAGEEMTLENLLYCALVASANEACNVIGEYISGSPLSFVNEMNSYANELGCTGTNFANTHGMPNDNHYTTAKDMYLIFREALSLPDFVKIVGTSSYTVPATNVSNSRRLTNTNELINPKSKLRYTNCKGGKTGYTEAAGHCLVSYAENDNMRLIAMVMGAGKKTGSSTPTDTLHFSESTNLYEWGFGNFSYQNILSSTELVTEVPVAMGKGKDSIILRPQSDITVIIDSSVPLDKISRDIKIYSAESEKPLMAPINAGDVLGEISLHYGGVEYGKTKLVASTNVALSSLEYLRSEIAALFSHTLVKLLIFLILVIFVLYIVLVIRYNKNRRLARQRAAERAQMARQEQLRREGPSTGKSFEDIEDMIQRREKSKK